MPLRDQGQLRKRWRYVGLFAEELMLCAARAEVGPFQQSFWVLWDRESRRQWTHTALRPGSREVVLDGPRLEVDAPGLRAILRLGEGEPIEVTCPSGRSWAWTRKRAGLPIEGTVEVPGRRWEIAGRGVDDESAGYHARRTSWRWSAGVGKSVDGRALAWNLGSRGSTTRRAAASGRSGSKGSRPSRPASTSRGRRRSPSTAAPSTSPPSRSTPKTTTSSSSAPVTATASAASAAPSAASSSPRATA